MKNSRGKFLASLALVCAVGLSGCGGSDDSSSEPVAASTSSSASSSSTRSGPSAKMSSSSSSGSRSASSPASKKAASTSAAAPKASGTQTPNGKSVGVPRAAAVRISIPSIGLNNAITPGGLNNGVLNPPGGVIQQFTGYGRVKPGMPGIAVLAGHVTLNGPDIFYSLHRTPVGGKVTISYADGTHKDFVVTNKASVGKTALQNDMRVWGGSSTPVVALVTCDADSQWVNAQHRSNNYVVWAKPV